jgi:hypothetical protein
MDLLFFREWKEYFHGILPLKYEYGILNVKAKRETFAFDTAGRNCSHSNLQQTNQNSHRNTPRKRRKMCADSGKSIAECSTAEPGNENAVAPAQDRNGLFSCRKMDLKLKIVSFGGMGRNSERRSRQFWLRRQKRSSTETVWAIRIPRTSSDTNHKR